MRNSKCDGIREEYSIMRSCNPLITFFFRDCEDVWCTYTFNLITIYHPIPDYLKCFHGYNLRNFQHDYLTLSLTNSLLHYDQDNCNQYTRQQARYIAELTQNLLLNAYKTLLYLIADPSVM